MAKNTGVKRYHLQLPETLFDEVQRIANNRQTSVVDELRKAIQLWLVITKKIEEDPNTALILREGDKERELVLLG